MSETLTPGTEPRAAPFSPVSPLSRARNGAGPLVPVWVSLWLLSLCATVAGQEARPLVHTSTYVRTDSDRTTVVSPRVQLGMQATPKTRLDMVYTVDVWTSASIDIRTAATKVVTEQRDELDLSVAQQLGDLTIAGSYRYSTENDYRSHGGALTASLDLAQNNTNLAISARAYIDEVWRSGDPGKRNDASTATLRGSLTQVLDRRSFVQLVYELTRQDGYLSSPYRYVRFVRAGAPDGDAPLDITTCGDAGASTFMVTCQPENNPDQRLRHAVAIYGRYGLLDDLSLGASYRYYADDWSVSAHTARIEGALSLTDAWLVAAGYRFYRQTSAQHYSPFYELSSENTAPRFVTSDKELSALTGHRVDLEVSYSAELDKHGTSLRAVLLGGPTFYSYPEFPLLDRITAFELTLALEVQQ